MIFLEGIVNVEQSRFPNSATFAKTQQKLMRSVFGWMFAGLSMTAIIAIALSMNPDVPAMLVSNSAVFWGIVIAQIVIVFALSIFLFRLPVFLATLGYFLYAALTGVTFTVIVYAFDLGTIASAFFISAGMFGVFAVVGYVTKIDLSKIGNIAIMAIVGLFIASLVNLFFFKSSFVELLISYGMVILFCVVTAFDIQTIKRLSENSYEEDTTAKLAIYGAFMLYIDFIAIFRNLIYILGSDD